MFQRKGIVAAFIIALLALAVSACGSTKSSTNPAVNHAQSAAKAVASTPANTTAETDVKAKVKPCVAPYENQPLSLLHHGTLKKVTGCIAALVPPKKRTQAGNCALKIAAHDRVWRKPGFKKFEDTDAATCVEQATKA